MHYGLVIVFTRDFNHEFELNYEKEFSIPPRNLEVYQHLFTVGLPELRKLG